MEDKAEGSWGSGMSTATGLAKLQTEANILARNQAMQAMTQINTGYGAALGQEMAKQAGIAPRRINISITEVENGRLITVEGRTYIVGSGDSLMGVMNSALVELKLEN